jgi:hypothetical protein
MDQHLHSIVVNIGTVSGTVVTPLWRVPTSESSFGGVTLTGAYAQAGGTVTNQLSLTVGTALGTASTGTIGTLNATLTANVPQAFTVNTAYVASGSWVQLKTNAGGGLAATTLITLEYKWGR